MNLLKTLLLILNLWRPAFCKKQAHLRAISLAIAGLCAIGKKTITNIALFRGLWEKIPIADYKFYSESPWKAEELFNPILSEGAKLCHGDYLTVAADDTRFYKTGKKIPGAGWYYDPLGPPFQTNLIWGLRSLQFSMILPLYSSIEGGSARALPIRCIPAPHVKKPGKRATDDERKEYQQMCKKQNLSTTFIEQVHSLRLTMDQMGLEDKTLIMSADGSFCNKTCMAIDDPRIVMIARCRKDAKLCFQAPQGARKFYDDIKFTPEQVRQDKEIKWETGSFFYGGQWREISYKYVENVLWQSGTKRQPLHLIVLAPLPYFRGGKRNYRNPSYVLTTARGVPIEILIQAYLDRWQIEYNFRDEKSILGVGEAQVWNETSVQRQPAFHVAVYSALMLAGVIAYQDKDHPDFGPRPAWREAPKRLTCRALMRLLQSVLLNPSENLPEELSEFGLTAEEISMVFRLAA